jgi:hypothetical protein
MSCQRCGGVLPSELAAAMYELVCDIAVIESPHCHCDDVVGPLHVKTPRECRVALARELSATITARGGVQNSQRGKRVLMIDEDERSDAV